MNESGGCVILRDTVWTWISESRNPQELQAPYVWHIDRWRARRDDRGSEGRGSDESICYKESG